MAKTNYVPIHERRLLIISIVVSVLVSQLADVFARDTFSTFYQQTIITKMLYLVGYIVLLILSAIFIMYFLFKIFKIKI